MFDVYYEWRRKLLTKWQERSMECRMKNALKVDNFLSKEPWVLNINTKVRCLWGPWANDWDSCCCTNIASFQQAQCYSNNAQAALVIILITATTDEQVETWNVINCIIQPISCWKETKKIWNKRDIVKRLLRN